MARHRKGASERENRTNSWRQFVGTSIHLSDAAEGDKKGRMMCEQKVLRLVIQLTGGWWAGSTCLWPPPFMGLEIY